MKYLIILLVCIGFMSCSQENNQTEEPEVEISTVIEERGAGFSNLEGNPSWKIGTDEFVNIVVELDKAWQARDWETMKSFMSDTAKFAFDDGQTASSPDEFIEIIKSDDPEGIQTWSFDYAFSVDVNPDTGGEHVHAKFTGTTEGSENKDYHEWYYIIDGKIINWWQYSRALPVQSEE